MIDLDKYNFLNITDIIILTIINIEINQYDRKYIYIYLLIKEALIRLGYYYME